jgi:hypothetical protein
MANVLCSPRSIACGRWTFRQAHPGVTTSTEGEHAPVWSPDGKYIAYVSWTEDGGDIWRVPAVGGRPEKLTTQSAFYDNIMYSPTGSRIVANRAPRTQRAILNDEINPALVITDLVWIPATGGAANFVSTLSDAGRPHFTSDTTRIWLYEGGDGLVSFRWDGTDRKAHLKVTGYQAPGAGPNAQPRQASDLHVSPDGQRVLAQVDNMLFVVPLPMTGGTTPTVSVQAPTGGAIPFRRLSRIGGDFVGWTADSRKCSIRWDGRSSTMGHAPFPPPTRRWKAAGGGRSGWCCRRRARRHDQRWCYSRDSEAHL